MREIPWKEYSKHIPTAEKILMTLLGEPKSGQEIADQFGLSRTAIWKYVKELEKDGAYELGRIYVKFREEAEKDESLIDQAKAWLKKLEEGDEQAKSYHERFNSISLKHANEILDELGVRADENLGESFYVEKSQELVEELIEKVLEGTIVFKSKLGKTTSFPFGTV